MKLFRDTDTIVAIATPLGPGGIGIVRMSGPASLAILKSVFRPANPNCAFKSHILYYGFIHDPQKVNSSIDEALCVYMKAPRTYTREDVVELQCHSGPAVLNRILQVCQGQGARLAGPGEFTLRAFINGRIDLSQAEAVDDLIRAQAEGLRRMSLKGLEGGLSRRIASIREALLSCISALEVAIDYPEEDNEILKQEQVLERIEAQVIAPVMDLINAYELSAVQRFGARVLLVGRPNAGKSSLLNALSCEERAIVTEVPGTTRDIIEKQIEIDSVPVILMDTAGIRDCPDPIEAMGIDKIRQTADSADMFLWLLDPVQGIGQEEAEVARLIGGSSEKPVALVINKVDKIEPARRQAVERELSLAAAGLLSARKGMRTCLVSAKTGQGLGRLGTAIAELLINDRRRMHEIDIAPNLRQKEVLKEVLSRVIAARKGLVGGLSVEIVAIDLRQALEYLGQITGETATEDILNRIFSSFCLGK